MQKICTLCKERLPSIESCACSQIRFAYESIFRIPFGDEEYDWETSRCPDCGVPRGSYHHENCTCEFCPVCGDLLTVCDCETDYADE